MFSRPPLNEIFTNIFNELEVFLASMMYRNLETVFKNISFNN